MDANVTNRWGLTFHHLGLAVKEPEAASAFLAGLGYSIGPVVFDPLQNVHLIMCKHPSMTDIEIIYPAKGIGPLDELLLSHQNGLVYHMCYVSEDVDASLEALEEDGGLRLFSVTPPKPAILFGGNAVSFYNVAGVGLIEIIDDSTPAAASYGEA